MTAPVAYTLDDPRPFAAEAPYTYFLPTPGRLAAFGPDDLVQIIFRSTTSGTKWDAERMWVWVTSAGESGCRGLLDSEPDDMPGLSRGDEVFFERWHAINVIFIDPANDERFPPSPAREYWERCLVDQAILDGMLVVGYIYREEPDLGTADDKYPDSGWRIRGDKPNSINEEIDPGEPTYIALGKVLNCDDSWLHLIDEPIGSAFRRDFESGDYVPVRRESSSLQ